MIKREESTRKNNVIDLFSKKPAYAAERNKVDYSMLDQLHGRRRLTKSDKGHRDNLVVLFPSFCA